jgi:hypothetical protein
MADFKKFPFFGEAGHGFHRSHIEVYRLRRRVRIHGRRAGFLPRQAIQERSQALQAVQGEARERGRTGSFRDADRVFGVQDGDDGSVQADAGQTCAVPLVFPEEGESACGCGPIHRGG